MSFDLSFNDILIFAASLFNSLWPIFKIPLGLVLAFGIINWVYKMIETRMTHLSS